MRSWVIAATGNKAKSNSRTGIICLTAGCAFTATVMVVNYGLGAGDAGVLRLWLDHPGPAVNCEAGDVEVPVGTMALGSVTNISFTGLTATNGTGTFSLRAFVDADNAAVEQNEDNNQFSVKYVLKGSSLQIIPVCDGVDLAWCSYFGQSYTLYRCTNLTEGFLVFKDNIVATPPTNTVHDASPPSRTYYRLSVH